MEGGLEGGSLSSLRSMEELTAQTGGRYLCPLPDAVEPPIGRY